MFAIPQLAAAPFVPFAAQAPAAGVVTWPMGLQVAVWLVLAALVGTALGILRDRVAGWQWPRVEMKRRVRRRRHTELRHA
jgi:hypothetical protein